MHDALHGNCAAKFPNAEPNLDKRKNHAANLGHAQCQKVQLYKGLSLYYSLLHKHDMI